MTFDVDSPEVGDAPRRFNILVCVDGSEECYRALRYAVRIGSGTDADLTLLYVRPIDQGLRTGGLQISVARENLLEWGLDLPGTKVLKKGMDILIELGYMGENWNEELAHTDVRGDPLGDNMTSFTNEEGRAIRLKLMVSPSVARGILDECEMGEYDLTIVAKTDGESGGIAASTEANVAETVAIEHTGTVLVARELEQSHGHLVCVTDNEESIQAARRDAEIASRCACPVYLFSVARYDSDLASAEHAVAAAKVAIEEVGIRVSGEEIVIGDPVEEIVREGMKHSVIVLSTSPGRVGWRRFFYSSVSYHVLKEAKNSVMIAR